jgi:SAM-dependent methyltransferase
VVSREEPVETFLNVGRSNADSIKGVLEQNGMSFAQLKKVLDFGCGCCRVMRYFADHLQSIEFVGTDIDELMINWNKNNILGPRFFVSAALPPLPFGDTFDFIYCISVFTHLNEVIQWLEELRRALNHKGIVLLTTHGTHVFDANKNNMDPASVESFLKKGFCYISNIGDGVLPDWYQTSFHSEEYIRSNFGRFFEVLDFILKV